MSIHTYKYIYICTYIYICRETSVHLHSSESILGIPMEVDIMFLFPYTYCLFTISTWGCIGLNYRAWSPMGHGVGFASDMLCQIIVVVIGR